MKRKKYKRKIRVCFSLIIIAMILVLGMIAYIVWDKNSSDKKRKNKTSQMTSKEYTLPEEFKELRISKYTYPKGFKMGKNLKNAIAQYMSYNDKYDEKSTDDKGWGNDFSGSLVSACREGFDFIDKCLEDGEKYVLTKNEVEYLNYSFTGKNIRLDNQDYDNLAYQHSDFGFIAIPIEKISSYKVVNEKDDCVHVIAEYGRFGAKSNMEKPFKTGEYDIWLKKNPYSCYDGYSVLSIKRKNEKYTAIIGQVYKAYCSYDMDFGYFVVYEFPDELQGSHFSRANFDDNPELKKFAEEHKDTTLEIEFKLEKHEKWVSEVKPISVKVHEN